MKNLSISYDDKNNGNFILKNINFKIQKGDKIGIVGESGSGKTTLVKCILGMHKIPCSSVEFDNTCINKFKNK